jgi:hypothetical protein
VSDTLDLGDDGGFVPVEIDSGLDQAATAAKMATGFLG